MRSNSKWFSKELNEKHIIYRFFGIKYSVKNPKYINRNKIAIRAQNNYDLSILKNARKIILFLTPPEVKINGGVMSIYSLCEESRKINPDSVCIISTYPNAKFTYASNDKFPNNEKIYRFSQIIDNCENLSELIIHIPEYYSKDFYSDLNKKDKLFLKSVKNIHLNILNQNIDVMPKPQELQDLYKITDNITQTIAHNRCATQEICNYWQIPTHFLSVDIPLNKFKKYNFADKEKIIVLSNDINEYKDKVTELLKKDLPEFKIVVVENLSFPQYMELIAKAYFVLSLGEGFDGYFIQPQYVGSLGFAVYNDDFFPSDEWKNLTNVYQNYFDLLSRISRDIKRLSNDSNLYYKTIDDCLDKLSEIYNRDKRNDNLARFYRKEYDFYPETRSNKEVCNALQV